MAAALNRPTRTAAQGTVALAIVEFIDAFFFDMSNSQYGAAVALLTIFLSLLLVIAESKFDLDLRGEESG